MKRKVSAKTTSEPQPSGGGGGRVFMEGQVVRMRPDGHAVVRLRSGAEVPCRRPSTVDGGWLRAAVAAAPIEVEGTLDLDRGAGSIWCVFPGPAHAEIAAPTLTLVASERVSIRCGKASVSLEKDGSLQVRGRDLLTRGSRSVRLSGATVHIN